MDYHEEADIWDTEVYPRTEMYMAKRIGAYLFDLIISALIIIGVFYFLEADLNDAINWVYIVLLSGALNFVSKVIMEGIAGRSFGKMFFGLLIVTPEGETTIGQAFVRNISNLIPLVGPLVDLVFGRSSATDDRQKMTDAGMKTLVIEDIALPVEEPVRRVYREPIKMVEPKQREKIRLDYRQLRVGNCPRCSAPYRILPPEDSSFSGLWNHRCTWCNHLIKEDPRE